VELAGKESIEGHDNYKLELTLASGERAVPCGSDAKTFLESKIGGEPRKLDGKTHPVAIFFRDLQDRERADHAPHARDGRRGCQADTQDRHPERIDESTAGRSLVRQATVGDGEGIRPLDLAMNVLKQVAACLVAAASVASGPAQSASRLAKTRRPRRRGNLPARRARFGPAARGGPTTSG